MEIVQKNVNPPTGENLPDNSRSNAEHFPDVKIVNTVEPKVTSSHKDLILEPKQNNGLLSTINPERNKSKKGKVAKVQNIKKKSFSVYISKRNKEPFTEKDFFKQKLILNRLALSACKDGSWQKFFPLSDDVLAVDEVVLDKPTVMKLVCANFSTADWLRRIKLPVWLKVVSKKRFKELEMSHLIKENSNVIK